MAADDQSVCVQRVENEDNQAENDPQSSLITLEVLHNIKEAQQQHGLRHGDYQRYRQYCARRIRRIRKSLHFHQGSKNKVQPKKITEEHIKDVRYLYLPLVDAERAWATAMQLKSESNTEPRKKFHMVSRLKKAVTHADALSALCESDKCDARTKLEAKAYVSWIKGSLFFETENWKIAIEHFTKAKTIYEKLASAFSDEVKDIYLQRCEEISPNIRYCAYNIGDESAINDLMQMRLKSGRDDDALTSKLDELIEKTRERQSATLSEVTWRGRTVPVKNEQVRVFLLSVQETSKQLEEADSVDQKLSIYESLLNELIDAQQSLKEEYKEDPSFKAILRGQSFDGRVPNAVYLHTYLAYLRQVNTIERNLLLIENLKANLPGVRQDDSKKMSKPQDLARLYEIIIQNLSDIPKLPGLDEDQDIAQEVAAQTQSYKALRCFYITQTYLSAKKWKEAMALLERTQGYAKSAMDAIKNTRWPAPQKQKGNEEMKHLIKEVEGLQFSSHASSILDTDSLADQMATLSVKDRKKPLVSRLDEYVEDPSLTSKKANLAPFPPDFEPVPTKPLYYDVALSLVKFPSLEDKMEQKKQAGGISGFVKGWLSWGGNK